MLAARVLSASEEPGKFVAAFAALNMGDAGSLAFTPKVMPGTSPGRLCSVRLSWVNWPPKLRLCEPRVQVSVSLKSLSRGLRRLAFGVDVALLIPAALIPRLKPP